MMYKLTLTGFVVQGHKLRYFWLNLRAFWPYIDSNATDTVTWTILTLSLLPFWALNVLVALLSLEGQKTDLTDLIKIS